MAILVFVAVNLPGVLRTHGTLGVKFQLHGYGALGPVVGVGHLRGDGCDVGDGPALL